MSNKKTKLELTWIGKEIHPKLEPRVLLFDNDNSYQSKYRVSPNDIFDNHLIYGDNLLALKALEQKYSGSIKCVYIDPPFNTQQAFEHYKDGLEHSHWLSLMRDRILLIHKLMSNDGSFFVHIDDNELGYLIAIIDEIFGRHNRISIITFKQSSVSGPKAKNPGIVTTNNFLLYYVKDKTIWQPNKVYIKSKRDDRYSKFIVNREEPHERWKLINLRDAFLKYSNLNTWEDAKKLFLDKLEEKINLFVLSNSESVVRTARVAPEDVNETAREILLRSTKERNIVQRCVRDKQDDYYFLNGEQLIFYRTKTRLIDGELSTATPLTNLWDDILSNNLHKEGGVSFPNGKKPEALIKRCLELATIEGDLVLDSFAGSGTTGAVAHKMRRRWIMIELGEHCHTHIIPRLQKVIEGVDESGITKSVNWQGGGGFRYYTLAPSLLEKDKWDNWVVNKEYNPAMLAEALCKLEGFTYSPSDTLYWQHGYSNEHDFIYVTTANLSNEQLQQLSDEVGNERTLLVLCSSFRGNENHFSNLTIKKIPDHVLSRCEWGHDDYSLMIENLPEAIPNKGQQNLFDEETV